MRTVSDKLTNVVLGATSGIGTAVARRLAPQGPLIVAGRNETRAKELANELGPDARPVVCDMTDAAQIAGLASEIGRLGAIVITAGGAESESPGVALDLNLGGPARVAAAVDHLVEPGSVCIFFGSVGAYIAPPTTDEMLAVLDDPTSPDLAGRFEAVASGMGMMGYQFAKLALARLTQRLAISWAPRGGRCLCLVPGVIATPLSDAALVTFPEGMEALMRLVAQERMGEADEVAAVVEFLCSPGAAYMTGSEVVVDGGFAAKLSIEGFSLPT
jgi:NAD(P)-dependent dehydrogenase (short-subunit alcohol dehydrogenase family)